MKVETFVTYSCMLVFLSYVFFIEVLVSGLTCGEFCIGQQVVKK